MKKRKRMTEYLTPDDRREAQSIADALDLLRTKYRGRSIPNDELGPIQWRLDRLAKHPTCGVGPFAPQEIAV